MRKLAETVFDVPFLMDEWDTELNSLNGIFPQQLGSQSNTYAYWKCKYEHRWKAKINNRYNGRGCPECSKRKRTSFSEQAVFFYIKQFFSDAINSYKNIFQNQMELDIFIPSLKLGIEYDGIAWHKSIALNREKEKYRICHENSVKLFRLKENRDHCKDSLEIADLIIPVEKPFCGATQDYRFLDTAIKMLFQQITSTHIDVNTKRDKNLIFDSYLAALENSSLQSLYPELSKQWHPQKKRLSNSTHVYCSF